MTIMFLEDEENENIQKIVTKIREIDAGKADAINEAYTDWSDKCLLNVPFT